MLMTLDWNAIGYVLTYNVDNSLSKFSKLYFWQDTSKEDQNNTSLDTVYTEQEKQRTNGSP